MKNMMMELSMEELELANGGWDFFDSMKKTMKKTLKDVGDFCYDNIIKSVYDEIIKPAGEGLNNFVFKPAFDILIEGTGVSIDIPGLFN